MAGRARFGTVSSQIVFQGEADTDGHGTNVASLSAGNVYGIAKGANLISVKVLGLLGGTDAGIAEGIGWVIDQVKEEKLQGKKPKAILNMSLGGPGYSAVMDDIIQQAVDEGIIVIVAAGNDGADASEHKPANQANTITVGATDINDKYASFSNYGSMVDISGPGVSVVGAYSSLSQLCTVNNLPPEQCYVIISGTSQATPHVTGVVARYLSSLSDNEMDMVNQEVIRDMLAKTASMDYIAFNSSIHLNPTTNKLLYKNCGLTPYNLSAYLPTTATTQTPTTQTTTASTTATTTRAPITLPSITLPSVTRPTFTPSGPTTTAPATTTHPPCVCDEPKLSDSASVSIGEAVGIAAGAVACNCLLTLIIGALLYR